MEVKVNIPDYFSIKDWRFFNTLEHLSVTDKMLTFVSYISNIEREQMEEWTPQSIQSIYSKILEQLASFEPEFYPVIEIDGVLYGYSSISKMTLGEYVDLERLAKNPVENLEQIIAILYRPIEKHSFGGIKWAIKSKLKTAVGKAENLFNYYTLEKYDSSKREINATKLTALPASFALGALGFFLNQGNISLLSSNLSSPNRKVMKMQIQEIANQVSVLTGDGLGQFINYQKVPSFQSQEIKVSLN